MKYMLTAGLCAALFLLAGCTGGPRTSITPTGELEARILRNYDKMETERYQPQNVFLDSSTDQGWPGDTEGRTILALVRDAQSSGRAPKFLDEMIRLIPERLNAKGYIGPIYEGKKNEQQLSGHGWFLRGLCEYYKWKKDPAVLDLIKGITYQLFMVNPEDYAAYPIDPKDRTQDVGEAIGSNDKTIGNWILSTDVGCIFIATDGLIEANELLHDPAIDKVINDVIGKFLVFDPVGIRAQAHATLTGCRALLRYCFAKDNPAYLHRVEEIWTLYKQYCMTENYENYNWFCRYNSHSEPCAIVDSYMVAYQLWQLTGNAAYLDDAELIYYNGICHTQHDHGGFGLDNNPGRALRTAELTVNRDEVYWCCTMRGAEGFWSVLNSSYDIRDGRIYVPFYYGSTLTFGEDAYLTQEASYPFGDEVVFTLHAAKPQALALRIPAWAELQEISLNGEKADYKVENGFAMPDKALQPEGRLTLKFGLTVRTEPAINSQNTRAGQFRVCYGPFVLGLDPAAAMPAEDNAGSDMESEATDALTTTDRFTVKPGPVVEVEGKNIVLRPLYHLMDPAVKTGPDYRRQILF
ncbi:MAG: glycoside hydrolase family 127 protein [Bacteroidales bacterium]|nr:glycoside hydrolase family 127 protein [Bacteroidales bacterium]